MAPERDQVCGKRDLCLPPPKGFVIAAQWFWRGLHPYDEKASARARRTAETPDCDDGEFLRRRTLDSPARSRVAGRNDADDSFGSKLFRANHRARRGLLPELSIEK